MHANTFAALMSSCKRHLSVESLRQETARSKRRSLPRTEPIKQSNLSKKLVLEKSLSEKTYINIEEASQPANLGLRAGFDFGPFSRYAQDYENSQLRSDSKNSNKDPLNTPKHKPLPAQKLQDAAKKAPKQKAFRLGQVTREPEPSGKIQRDFPENKPPAFLSSNRRLSSDHEAGATGQTQVDPSLAHPERAFGPSHSAEVPADAQLGFAEEHADPRLFFGLLADPQKRLQRENNRRAAHRPQQRAAPAVQADEGGAERPIFQHLARGSSSLTRCSASRRFSIS